MSRLPDLRAMSPSRLSPHGLLWAVLAALALCGLGVPSVAVAGPGSRSVAKSTDSSRPPLVVVRSVGAVPDADARLACRALLAELQIRCEVRAARSLDELRPALDAGRGQLDARKALELLFRDRATDALVELDLTGEDIFEAGKPFVFGLASLSDRVALISTARLVADDDATYADRLAKLVMHEAGHTFGLHHHDHGSCVMRQDPSVASLDEAPKTPCARCRQKLARRTETFARPGQLALDQARGHLVRDDPATARQLLLGTVWAGEYDPGLLHEFGVAFHKAGQLDDAIGIFKFLVEESADHARGHVSLAIAYQARDAQGDPARAVWHFERALDLRPEWTTVASHLDELQSREST